MADVIIMPMRRKGMTQAELDAWRHPRQAWRNPQYLLPSSDRRNIIELWRVRIDREYLRVATARRLDEMSRRRKARAPAPPETGEPV